MKTPPIILMGILNITPDSFSDGGDYLNPQRALERTKHMMQEGAAIIDIGGESTRPGSETVSEEEELHRVIPIITLLRKKLGDAIKLSIDTWKAPVAKEALAAGVDMVNSLGGFTFDEKLAEVIAQHNCTLIMYHSKGKPKTMQQGTITYTDVMQEIADFFEQQIAFGKKHGVKRNQCILDPGIGFGKTLEHNIEILKKLSGLKRFDLPILIGVSRKSHLGMILKDSLGIETKPTERLEASLAETAIAVQNGATIVRTHDIIQTRKFLAVLERFL